MTTAVAGRLVLGVFAHPDDESLACGGTLARLASLGARVVVMTASHGERGGPSGPVRDDALGARRSIEMQEAARALGVSRLFVWDHPDGNLQWSGVSTFHADLVLFMRRHRPAAVITFGDDGLYWHLDHVGVHERTTAAVRALGADAPPLYYATMARGIMPEFVAAARERGWTAPRKGFWSLIPEAFGIAAEPPTITIDVRDCVERKLAALQCHHSQVGDAFHPFAHVTLDDARRLLGLDVLPPCRHSDGRPSAARNAMKLDTLDLLRCPFCGGRLELVTSMFHRAIDDEIHDGILGCHCCIFPVVDGIPVLHLRPDAIAARDHIDGGRPQLALRAMVGLEGETEASRFEAAAARESSTFKEIVEALGPNFEGGYLLYRFSDPTFIVANAVVRGVARTVLGGSGRRAIDICGGSGHLTRSLMDLSPSPPVLADLFFPKVWLARRFTAPGCEPVCCDGNSPLPFARGAFGYAMCSDAFQYIWTKRLFVGEMARLVDSETPGAVVINHTHNQLTWSPSHGQPLSPAGYANLFEGLPLRLFGEAGLFADVTADGSVDLGRRDSGEALDGDPALTLVASRDARVFARHAPTPAAPTGEYRINPLYVVEDRGDTLHLRLSFPDEAYADEYGACRQYLPEQTTIRRDDLAALQHGARVAALDEPVRRRVIVELPHRYY